MLSNYLLTAFRSIDKNKRHFLLNLAGLSIGFAAAILMALYAQHELSYDKQHPDSERTYLAHADFTSVGLQTSRTSLFAIAGKLQNHSQVEDIFKIMDARDSRLSVSTQVQIDGMHHRLNNFYVATSNIVDFIRLERVAGDIRQALTKPDQLVLSKTEAIRLFGTEEVVGRKLAHEGGLYTIGAVFNDLPNNTHFKFDSLIAMPAEFAATGGGYTYFKLLPDTNIEEFTQQHIRARNELFPWAAQNSISSKLIKLTDLHLFSFGPVAMKAGGSLLVLQICIALSIILVIIASINFINISVAQSAKRAKEVGVRKALGATQFQLVVQFLSEYLLLAALAALQAFVLVELILPAFNQMMDRQLTLDYGSEFMFGVLGVILLVGLVAGLYPALFIASFSAKRVLSGDLIRGGTAIFVRKLTLCLQSALSVGLIIAAICLYQQMSLIDQLNVGYEKHNRLVVKHLPADVLFNPEQQNILNSIKQLSGVEQVTISNTDLTNDMDYMFEFIWPNGAQVDGVQPSVSTGYYAVETLGLTLLAGRDFSPEFAGDWFQSDEQNNKTLGIIVTRRMLELAGYQDFAAVLGLQLQVVNKPIKATIVGVVENVKIGSARQQVLPMSFNLGFNPSSLANIVVKTSDRDVATLNQQISQIVREQLHFTDVTISPVIDDYANAHKNEHQALQMVSVFSVLAIFLTCLGTFGLASFSTLRRQKEIAIRKVLGASRFNLVNLLAKEFLQLSVISIVLACPLTYWLVAKWLANFNERIEQAALVYIFSALIILMITWLTVAVIGLKVASSRPSLVLRYE
ncbi:FtsX-like permease family protein [Catenovulum sp. SX2]|uniref:ABC transporter permease n=1 Tax=Catenovulum sp. SX2 TaxID=3398614 RepID=UPI003F86DBFD